jgi:Uncharacterised nucleotidyltransferase
MDMLTYRMNASGNYGYIPTPLQEALLRASLLEGDEALNAWNYWKSNTDMDMIDQGSYRLLPLLYRNLSLHGVKGPLLEKFKGIYKATWRNNQMLFHKMAALLSSFHNAGIRTMLLKGSALTLLHYKDYGLRPMNDLDVLVRTEQVLEAHALLCQLGWKPKLRLGERFTEKCFSVRHAYGYEDASGLEFDLHRHVLPECSYEGSDDFFWDGAVPVQIRDVSTSALNPTAQLLHVCLHGSWWNIVPPFRWIADAMIVMKTSGSLIHWDRLMAEAQECRVVLPLRNALDYTSEKLYAPVPSEWLRRMKDIHVSRAERVEYKYVSSPLSGFTGAVKLWIQHSRLNEHRGLAYKLFTFPRFLQYTWGADYCWQLPFYGIRKGILMLSGRINSYRHSMKKVF